jgi:3-phenylpropionate/cinnamic acid dioxygenase small subunit
MKPWEELTDFQQRLNPRRLDMAEADYSGKPLPDDLRYLADRMTILNHVTAYSFLIDEGRWDAWYALFSDDILFESTVPCFGTIQAKGRAAFEEFVNMRFRPPGSEISSMIHRHHMGNIHVCEQSESMARVRTYMLVTDVPEEGGFKPLTSGTYNMTLEKRDDRWLITRCYIEVDAPVKKSTIPDGAAGTMKFTPDDHPECE